MTNNRTKKISGFISLIIVFAIALGVIGSVAVRSVSADNDKTKFSSEITANEHAHGQVVNILPEDVRLWNESQTFDADYLNGLYEFSDLHREFLAGAVNDNARVVEIYRQADAFNPVNNVLRWRSTLENVKSYKVRVAYDNKFTKCVLVAENADINEGVTLQNPLTGTTYYWQVIATMAGGNKVYSPIFDFTVENSLRTVTVDGVSNTRDIGGYQTAFGYVKQGLVYRSARLESITEEGLYTLKNQLGVKTDLDLRGEVEATTGANRKNPANLKYYTYNTPQYALFGEIGLNYEGNFANVKSIMSVFADKSNYPIDFHCAVGRDRTGTIAALLKSLLGYAEQDIINDYFTSLFATTGAWDKSNTNINKDSIMNVFVYLNTFEGDTLADKTADYLISKCKMTQSDIDAIRDIMTGKVEIEIPMYNTVADTDNYADHAFVTFEKYGVQKVVKAVPTGGKVEAPFEAGDGYVWTLNDKTYDFADSVAGDITLIAVATDTVYKVNIVSTGAIVSENTVTVKAGGSFDFSELAKDGYDFIVLSDEGKVLTELKVVENSTINVVYRQK